MVCVDFCHCETLWGCKWPQCVTHSDEVQAPLVHLWWPCMSKRAGVETVCGHLSQCLQLPQWLSGWRHQWRHCRTPKTQHLSPRWLSPLALQRGESGEGTSQNITNTPVTSRIYMYILKIYVQFPSSCAMFLFCSLKNMKEKFHFGSTVIKMQLKNLSASWPRSS